MPQPKPPHLVREKTRHGALVWYVRVGQGPRVRMRELYGTDAFWRAYRVAVESAPTLSKADPGLPANSIAWLIGQYVASAEWRALKAATRRNRHSFYRQIETSPNANTAAKEVGPKSILANRQARAQAGTPHAANGFVAAMRALFVWGRAHGHVTSDPTEGIRPIKGANDTEGFHAWTDDEVERFHARWPLGTRERVAMDVLLYTGLRRGDAVQLGRPHVRDSMFRIRPEKTRGRTKVEVIAPILPELARTLAAGPIGNLTYITRLDGLPYDKQSFGYWFSKACRAAGVPGTAHGLRKAGARRAAENGATEAQLNALFGWADGSRESATYTRSANRATLARTAPRSRTENPDDPAPAKTPMLSGI